MGIEILVVDQEAETRAFLKTLLETRGYRVVVASTVSDAVDHACCQPPFLAIVDALFPDKGASRFVSACNAIPVIYISAIPLKSLYFHHQVSEPSVMVQDSDTPVLFLEKPVQEEDLFRLIQYLVDERSSSGISKRG